MARKKTMIAAAPVAKAGSPNSRTSSSGYRLGSSITPNAAHNAMPATMQPITSGSDHPREGASRMPTTRTATPPPITTAPGQSRGLGSDSLDVATVSVKTNSAAPAAANAANIDCQGQK
jgi:hypothetical protein